MNHFGKFWIICIEYMGFEGPLCISGQQVFSANAATRRHHALLSQSFNRYVCSKRYLRGKRTSVEFRCFKGTQKFFFCVWKPIFSGMHGLRFLSEAPWENVIFVFMSFISCSSYFYFYVVFSISYLIPHIPPCQNMTHSRFIVEAAHELRLMRDRCKNSWLRCIPFWGTSGTK